MYIDYVFSILSESMLLRLNIHSLTDQLSKLALLAKVGPWLVNYTLLNLRDSLTTYSINGYNVTQ